MLNSILMNTLPVCVQTRVENGTDLVFEDVTIGHEIEHPPGSRREQYVRTLVYTSSCQCDYKRNVQIQQIFMRDPHRPNFFVEILYVLYRKNITLTYFQM